MFFCNLLESCIYGEDENTEYLYVGVFDKKRLYFSPDDYYVYLDQSEIQEVEGGLQSYDTWGLPIFPTRKTGEDMVLPNGESVTIIGLSPMLPPHSTIFEYMIEDSQGNIYNVTEPGYIQGKYMEEGGWGSRLT